MADLIPARTFGFTVRYDGRANILRSESKISQAFDPSIAKTIPTSKTFNSIWDTGATGSVITKKVVDECGLSPIGMARVQTAERKTTTNVYLVSITLRNNIVIPTLRVTEGTFGSNDDILIGMDVISHGDFVVTNKDGKTAFSFRMPSVEFIDFVNKDQPKRPPLMRPGPKIGRNQPCPCGSGKKYKKCCSK